MVGSVLTFTSASPPTMSSRTAKTLLALILTTYLALAVGYGVVTPLFETPDEHLHYFTAEYIAREGRLPTTRDAGLMGQEAAQPPLYYVLAAPLVALAGAADASPALWTNPRTDPGLFDPALRGEPPINANMFVHPPAEAWPWQGYALAAHLIRLLSAAFGLGTLLCLYAAGRVVWPADRGRAVLATALVAFLPQYAFIHGAVSNDAAITFFSAAALWQLLRLLRPAAEHPRRAYVLLGLTVGLAMLSKAAGLLLLAFVVGVLVFRALVAERRAARAAVEAAGLVAGPALLVAGWLLWRNWSLYGDITAATQFVELAGGYRPYSLAQVWGDMDRVWLSLFAVFGWMTVRAPAWVYAVWTGIALLALAGGVWALARRRRGLLPGGNRFGLLLHPAVVLAAWFALVAAGWLQFMLRTPADQGRLFFPALVPLALGTAYGLSRWPRPWVPAAAALLALATSVYAAAVVIPRAYPVPPTVTALPDSAALLDIRLDPGLDLLAATVETAEARPGEWVWATLYWRARPELGDGAPLVYLEAFGRGFERVGEQVAYHGRGNYPATVWPAGAVVADRLGVRLDEAAVGPAEVRLTVKLDEESDGVDIGVVKLVPREWPEPVDIPLARLGESVELAAAHVTPETAAAGETVTVTLRWQVVAPPGPVDLHTFVHLGDPTRPPLAQTDGPVMGGEYPARLWAAGEVFEESIPLALPADLPPGQYPINAGLYDFASGVRLPVVVGDERQPTDTYPVGWLIVE